MHHDKPRRYSVALKLSGKYFKENKGCEDWTNNIYVDVIYANRILK